VQHAVQRAGRADDSGKVDCGRKIGHGVQWRKVSVSEKRRAWTCGGESSSDEQHADAGASVNVQLEDKSSHPQPTLTGVEECLQLPLPAHL
jgi:hypothetical protein